MSLKGLIPGYPGSTGVTLALRGALDPLFRALRHGISEFTFANIYLFRKTHSYRLSILDDDDDGKTLVISGKDAGGGAYFMLPFGYPQDEALLRAFFRDFAFMKNAAEEDAQRLAGRGFRVVEDRDNFDYLYSISELRGLKGRKYHKKKNLINAFLGAYECKGKPLLTGYLPDAFSVLQAWREESSVEGDYEAARDALERMDDLGLCGGIYYIGERPVAYVLGEELREDMFAVHFEKGVEGYRGLLQFINRDFVSFLPERYVLLNREQDLGDEGLRQAKMSWRPAGFTRKYRVYPG